jgi:hypothetical protein
MDARNRTPPRSRFSNAKNVAGVHRLRVAYPPGQPPQKVGRGSLISQQFHDGVTATEKHQPPVHHLAVQAHVEPKPRAVKRGRALQIRTADDDVVEAEHALGCRRFLRAFYTPAF